MFRKSLAAAITAIGLASSLSASARAEEVNPLGECILDHITRRDEAALVRWMVLNMAADPTFKDAIQIAPGEVDKANKSMGAVVTRLLTETCRKETTAVFAKDDMEAFEGAFKVFGETAGVKAASTPHLEKALEKFADYVDEEALATLIADAEKAKH